MERVGSLILKCIMTFAESSCRGQEVSIQLAYSLKAARVELIRWSRGSGLQPFAGNPGMERHWSAAYKRRVSTGVKGMQKQVSHSCVASELSAAMHSHQLSGKEGDQMQSQTNLHCRLLRGERCEAVGLIS